VGGEEQPTWLAKLPGGWWAWRGVVGFYARRPRSSPPMWVRGATLDEVADRAAEVERSRADDR